MNWIILTYCIYLICSALFTIWVGQTLYQNGRAYVHSMIPNPEMADTINKLLLVGFYLVNSAYVLFVLKEDSLVQNWSSLLELLATKIGSIVLILAGMHICNIIGLYILKKKKITFS